MRRKIILVIFSLFLFIPFREKAHTLESNNFDRRNKFYLKLGIGGGGINRNIPLKMWTTEREEVKVGKGGPHFSFDVGYNVISHIGIEAGLGILENTTNVTIENGDGYFKRYSFSITGIYHFLNRIYNQVQFNLYGGLGIGYYVSPKLYRECPSVETTVYYKNTSGPHILIGSSIIGKKWLGFIDLKYLFNVRYRFKNGVENGIKFNVPLFEEWKEVNGSGILFNIGLGYRF
jgi:hypothetical protein